MEKMWILFQSTDSMTPWPAWAGHDLGGSASHQCKWVVVVWVAHCRDGVMSCCLLLLFCADLSFLDNQISLTEEALPLREEKCGAFVASSRASHEVAAAPSFQACLHACTCTCCMCVCICVYVCVCMNMHICIYMHVSRYVWIYACMHIHVHMYVYAHLCIDFESQ